MITTLIVTVEIYYRWQIDIKQSFVQVFQLVSQRCTCSSLCSNEQRVKVEGDDQRGEGEGERDEDGMQALALEGNSKQSIIQLFEMYREEGLCPPKHKVNI